MGLHVFLHDREQLALVLLAIVARGHRTRGEDARREEAEGPHQHGDQRQPPVEQKQQAGVGDHVEGRQHAPRNGADERGLDRTEVIGKAPEDVAGAGTAIKVH